MKELQNLKDVALTLTSDYGKTGNNQKRNLWNAINDLQTSLSLTPKEMKKEEAHKILKHHQEWRKGADIEQTNVTKLTEAIDFALSLISPKEEKEEKKELIEPALIKAGDERLGLGFAKTPSKVDCRVIAEDQYQMLKKAYYNNFSSKD